MRPILRYPLKHPRRPPVTRRKPHSQPRLKTRKYRASSVRPVMTALYRHQITMSPPRRLQRPKTLKFWPSVRSRLALFRPISACLTARRRHEGRPFLSIGRFLKPTASSFNLLTSDKTGRPRLSSGYFRMFMEIYGCLSVSHRPFQQVLALA